MQFQEKELVDLAIKAGLWNFSPIRRRGRKYPRTLKYHREYPVDEVGRCDLFFENVSNDGIKPRTRRMHWVVEAKVFAEPAAIIQAQGYMSGLLAEQATTIYVPGITILAQFFRSETIFFAEKLGIQCLQIAPYTREHATVHEIAPHDFDKIRSSFTDDGWWME